MSNYTKITNFRDKDELPSGDPNKVVSGQLFADEFNAIATAIATKAELSDVVQPDPPKVARIETYEYPNVIFITDSNQFFPSTVPTFVKTATPASFTVSNLKSDNVIYRLSVTTTQDIRIEGSADMSKNVFASLFVRVTNNTTGNSFDTATMRVGGELGLTDVGYMRFDFKIPIHSEFFIDLSTLSSTSDLSDYTFTLYYEVSSNSATAGGGLPELRLIEGVDMILEELL